MSARMRTSSGTYNVRHNELVHEKVDIPVRAVKCIVHFLDDTVFTAEIDRRAKAQSLLDLVYDHLELIEKDYFGLLFHDEAEDHGDQANSREPRWLDPLKSLKKQFKHEPPYHMHFRVKFYVLDPSKLQEEYTRYHFFLQVKKDILDGKLVCPKNVAPLLASYAVQSELGDFSPDEHSTGYLAHFNLIPNQDSHFEAEVMKYHQQHVGQTPADSEFNYLDRAKHLEMYGATLHAAKDSSNIDIHLGVTAAGLVVFRNFRKVDTFVWSHIIKISFKRKQFFVQTRREGGECDSIVGFSMFTYRSCKSLWKSCVEHHSFFRLHHIKQSPKKWYQLGSKFRYSGRTEYETKQDSRKLGRVDRPFERTGSKTHRHTVGGNSYNSRTLDRGNNTRSSGSVTNLPVTKPALRNSFSARSGISVAASEPPNNWSSTLPSSNKRSEDDDGGFLSVNGSSRTSLIKRDSYSTRELQLQPARTDNSMRNMSRSHKSMDAISAAAAAANHPPLVSTASLPRSATMNGSYPQSRVDYSDLPNENGFLNNHSLVTICMKPDQDGRFGFNVKGGVDQGMPIIVSRVALGMPSDLCVPRLNEGDQVLCINSRDVTQHTHEQVVNMIRAARETPTGDLVLVVRPNVYVGEDLKEPEFHYVPETHHITTGRTGLDMLSESIMLLREGVESGAATAQFEQLYRRKPGLTNQHAKMSENLGKNRYRDISPYDQTRVILKNVASGDYINANYINMEIPGSGIVNRYIAAQGPLPNTSGDFWEMIWQQHITLVVMLTALVERGRNKCHQYWPHLYETTDFGKLQLTCLKEKETRSFAFREFTLVNIETSEERHIYQMQYIAWPDHGCPEDSSDFLHFVVRVRQKRIGMVEPTLVHCSAGIGRTGVLILMETAMCLIEANQPVYPLDIVRQMRDQRAMLIQTSAQYRFVCEAILRVYHEGLIRPIEDFRQ